MFFYYRFCLLFHLVYLHLQFEWVPKSKSILNEGWSKLIHSVVWMVSMGQVELWICRLTSCYDVYYHHPFLRYTFYPISIMKWKLFQILLKHSTVAIIMIANCQWCQMFWTTKQDTQLMTTSWVIMPNEISSAKLWQPPMIWPLTCCVFAKFQKAF